MNNTDIVDALMLCTPEDLKAVVAELAAANPEKAYDLGMAVYDANPTKMVDGPPPGSLDGMAVMRVVGVEMSDSHGRVKGIRFLRTKFQEMALSDAGETFVSISRGVPYELPPARHCLVNMEAAAWRYAGFKVEVVPQGEQPPNQHEVCFRQAVAMTCTAD